MTEAQSYYLDLGEAEREGGNFCRDDVSLVVNCTGACVLTQDFTSHMPQGRADFYLQYLTRGEMLVRIGDRTRIMRPGHAIMYYPRTEYQYSMYGQNEICYYWIHFTGRDAASLAADCGIPNRTVMDIGVSEPLILEFEKLFREFVVRDSCFPYMMAAGISRICTDVGRVHRPEAAESDSQGRLDSVLTRIHKNYGQDMPVEELAAQAHLSASRFRTLFKERTGLAPLDYLTALRVNQARLLMMQTDMSVGEIAAETGYPDQLYFSRMFRKRTGYAPSEYRAHFREKNPL